MTATTLEAAINLFDPNRPLTRGQLELYFVEREGTPLPEMRILLRQLRKPAKLLFTGHRGSGKTTELNKLLAELEDEFLIVHFSLLEALNTFDVNYVDLLLALGTRLVQEATSEQVIPRGKADLIKEELLDHIWQWFQRQLHGLEFRPAVPEASLSAKLHLLTLELEGKVATEALTRQRLRERLELRLSELIEWMNFVVDEIRRRTEKRTLIVVEDIDKLDLEPARRLFLEHARTLTAPRAMIIYSFPIALRYSTDFPQISPGFDEHFVLPNVRLNRREDGPDEAGRARMRQVVRRRLAEGLIEPQALETAVEASGGLMRTLVRLVRRAAVTAVSRGARAITGADVEKAVLKVRADYQAVLNDADYAVLAARHADKRLSSEPEVQRLLHNLSLLEYADGEPWCDVHPVVLLLMEERRNG